MIWLIAGMAVVVWWGGYMHGYERAHSNWLETRRDK